MQGCLAVAWPLRRLAGSLLAALTAAGLCLVLPGACSESCDGLHSSIKNSELHSEEFADGTLFCSIFLLILWSVGRPCQLV